jgi:hypothetical protein
MALAALVAFAACDEGTDVVVDVPVTGDIAGVVTIEGAAVSGVSVALSSGATTTTNGSGAYSFSGVAAGAYTITISGFAADATFSSTSKAATIVTTGQVATVNFDGAYVRTSAILGSVAAGGKNLPGVSVSIGSSTTQTDANGNYSFSGLRAGTYTLTISGFNAAQYAFATATQNVTVGVGESKVVSFAGQLLATSTISGTLYIDGNGNRNMDPGEPPVAKAGIKVALERAIGDTLYTTTDANGNYSFPNLAEGTYKAILLTDTTTFPGAFTKTAEDRYLAVATSGATTKVNFSFAVTTQYVQVYGMLGVDNVKAGVAPIKDWVFNLYPTDVDAAGSINNIVGTTPAPKTSASGLVTFKFLRKNDYSPNKAKVDGIVFAKASAPPGASYAINGEGVIEIPWSPLDSIVMAPDTFDATFGSLVLGFKADEVDGDPAAGWNVALKAEKDSTAAGTIHLLTGGNGMVYTTMTPAISLANGNDGIYPDTFWVRLSTAQTANNGHAYSTTIAGSEGTKAGRYVRFIWDGTTQASDTIMMGTETITYKDADIVYRAHHEADDSTGVTATFTAGDDFTEIGNVSVKILNADNTVAKAPAVLTLAGAPASMGPGSDRKYNLLTGKTYKAVATSSWAKLSVLKNDTVTFVLDGGNQIDTLDVLKGGAGASTFAYKMDNGTINGTLTARDGTPANGLKVRVMAGPGNIQGTKDTTVVVAGGVFTTLANLREGPYTVTVADSTTSAGTVWGFGTTLKTTSAPLPSGSANNADAHSGLRDVEGNANVKVANFLPDRRDTKIQGVIANDRDSDENTIDPDEALAGVVVSLYKDNSGTPTVSADSLVGTATTDASGAFVFSQLMEGRYIVKPGIVANTVILRGLTNGDTAIVVTAAAAAAPGTGNPDATLNPGAAGRTVGIISGFTDALSTNLVLPRWDYSNSTYNLKSGLYPHRQPHFTFLYANGVATGTVTKAGVAVAGMTISAVKCVTAAGYTSPPTIGAGVCAPSGVPFNVSTNASGVFTIPNLQEGVWQVTANPATAGLPDPVMAGLFVILGQNDVETGNFIIP